MTHAFATGGIGGKCIVCGLRRATHDTVRSVAPARKPLKESVDMSTVTRTDFKCDADDADTIEAMALALTSLYILLGADGAIGGGSAIENRMIHARDAITKYRGRPL